MYDDNIELPTQRCLYRQSSFETRLTPEVPPLSDEEESDEEIKQVNQPKVVNLITKRPNTGADGAQWNNDFRSKLEESLALGTQKRFDNQKGRSLKSCREEEKSDILTEIPTDNGNFSYTSRNSFSYLIFTSI